MDPAFPDIVGEWASQNIDDKAHVWTVTRGLDGRLEDRLDPTFLAMVDEMQPLEEILVALVRAAAEQDIADTRIW
jgi:hypothetical protein